MNKLFVAVIAGVSLLAITNHANAQKRAQSSTVPHEHYVGLIVKFKPSAMTTAMSASTTQVMSARAGLQLKSARQAGTGAVVYRFNDPVAPAEAKAAAVKISLDPSVEYAVPDQMMQAAQVTPNDPLFATNQWHLTAPAMNVGGANLPNAWQRTTGSNNVVVAVVDSGIRPGHPDLTGRLLPGYDFVSGDFDMGLGVPANWYSADGNGRDPDPTDTGTFVDAGLLAQLPGGYAAAAGIAIRPSSWHGTHVAGTIAAAGNNGVGVAGVDWNARILPVRALGRAGRGSSADILEGILWSAGFALPGLAATPTPARVINLSLGGSGACNAAYQDVINQVIAVGAIVVVATGNVSGPVGQPANCTGVIAVTAHARDGDNAEYANVGPQVHLSAPGGGCGFLSFFPPSTCVGPFDPVYSAVNNGSTVPLTEGYGPLQGTSMATPHVSGVTSLMLALSPGLRNSEVRSVLQSTVRPHPAGSWCSTLSGSGMCGTGLLDATGALTHVANNRPTINPGANQLVRPGATVNLAANVMFVGGRILGGSGWSWRQTSGPTVALLPPPGPTTSFVAPATGSLGFEFSAADTAGYSNVASLTVGVNSSPVITAVAPQTVTLGAPISGSVTATDADGDTVTFVATTMPAGMTFSAATGQYSWTPTTPGTHTLTVLGADSVGNGAATNVQFVVNDPNASSANAPSGGGGSIPPWLIAALLVLLALTRSRRLDGQTNRRLIAASYGGRR